MTRFLVPYLCDYKGAAIFMDCDMILKTDIADVMLDTPRLPERSVYVCQHDYTPTSDTKFLGQPQTAYPRKNWSSFMVFNCSQCKALTPEYVNMASGLELHRFAWTHDTQIGALPMTWNHLVGEYPHNDAAKCLHFTDGGPWHEDYRDVDHAGDWIAERESMLYAETKTNPNPLLV